MWRDSSLTSQQEDPPLLSLLPALLTGEGEGRDDSMGSVLSNSRKVERSPELRHAALCPFKKRRNGRLVS